jgi:Reverse transcriptase (RNA-dependent DNA polymerase)
LSPFLFRFYIRDLIDEVTKLDTGCNYFGTNINLLAYADDMVLLAPSWHGLQNLLNTIENAANNVNTFICSPFPTFSIADCNLLFVEHFKYLGHIIENSTL